MENKIKVFNGEGNVKEFIVKVELHSSLKGYTGEKCAQDLASRLDGPAFDVYMRLSTEDRKKADKIKEELLEEFEKGQLNREEAIFELSNRPRKQGESPHTYAYKLIELVKLAYPTFNDETRATLAKDYFVRGLHPQMQIALKSMEKFATNDIQALAEETTRLQLAGVNSNMGISSSVNEISANTNKGSREIPDDIVDAITDKVVDKINSIKVASGGHENVENDVSFTTNPPFVGQRAFPGRNFRGRGRGRQARGRGNFRSGYRAPNSQLKCRSCQSTDHLVASCPTRFCQACGQRGHDSWNSVCPKYQ